MDKNALLAQPARNFTAPNGRLTVGFLLASLHTGASRAVLPGILDAAEKQDVNLFCFPGGRLSSTANHEYQRNLIYDLAGQECINSLVTWSSSLGGVLGMAETTAFHQRYRALPMVSLAQFMEGVPTISVDSYNGMRSLLKHLLDKHAYRKLAFVRGPEGHIYAQERYRAYQDTLQAYHLPFDPALITSPLSWESGAEAIRILLDERGLKPGVDFQAVVAVSDLLAIWALKTLQARGFRVPQDVAVTGFNNSDEERFATPPLTTVQLPFYEQGGRSLDALLALHGGESVPALMTLPSRLIVRQSCGCSSSAVTRAAASVPNEVLELAPALEGCLVEMQIEMGGDLARFAPWLEPLVAAFGDEVLAQQGRAPGGKFISVLEKTLDEAMHSQQETFPWQNILSILREHCLPAAPLEVRPQLETLVAQARVSVSEASQHASAFWQWQTERQNEVIRETTRALLTAFDVQQLGDVLVEKLPHLGIPSAYLALYDGDGNPPEFSRLSLAFVDRQKVALEIGGRRFPTRQLLPPDLLPANRRYSFVVEPLFFREKPLGYIVCELGPRTGDTYELLRASLSSALQGALLFDEIQRARITAEKADRIKTRLLANVSHEMRTPLNIILGYTQSALNAPDTYPPETAALMQHIQSSAEHQLRVINDLLDLSRAEIDELDLALELVDPRPLLVDAFQSMAVQSAGPEVTWKLDIPARLPLARADTLRLRQILLNLLSNARKFTEQGQITLGVQVAPPYLHIWVADTGPGIPAEQQEHIFEPFVTIEQDRRISGGIGLGLSITRHLVALHGGKMALDSQPGQGSTFHIYLPLPALDQARLPTDQVPSPVLLVLSASEQIAPEIKNLCRCQQLDICQVRSSEELENALVNTRPAALAWDLSAVLPSDWPLVRRLRHYPALSQVPFILYGQDAQAAPELSLGLTSFVVKAADSQTLLDAILTLCPTQRAGAVLVVDDDPQVRAAHQKLAESALPGLSVLAAENGEKALALMSAEPPALVLLDMVMPGLSGADVLDRMRANPRLRQVPVIVLSNKLLDMETVRRLENHARVTFQSKEVWSESEAVEALGRVLNGSEALPAHTSALVKQAIAYLQQNYSRPLGRWEIAQAIGVSEDYLSRVFNRELGISPWEYLTRYRILQAKKLLKQTNAPVGAVARQVGFKDQAYFSRVFHKLTQVSPQEYREKREQV